MIIGTSLKSRPQKNEHIEKCFLERLPNCHPHCILPTPRKEMTGYPMIVKQHL
jgi:hypothetical protein